MKYFNLLNLTFVYLFIFALISVRKKIGGGFEPRLGGKQIRDLPLSYKVVCDTSLCLLTYTNNSSPIKKRMQVGFEPRRRGWDCDALPLRCSHVGDLEWH
jgi:hypothetical protein